MPTPMMSLYCRVTLSPAQLAELFRAPTKKVQDFKDWKQWWSSKATYGDSEMPKNLDALNYDDCPTVGDGIQAWTNADDFFAESQYDSGVWRFSILEFSDNFREMTGMIAILRTAVQFSASADDFMIIAPYTEHGDTGAYLVFEKPDGRFLREPSAAHEEEARAYVERRLKDT